MALCFRNGTDNDNCTAKSCRENLLSFEDQGENKSECREFSNPFSQGEEIEQVMTVNEFNKKKFRNPGKKLILFCIYQTFTWFKESILIKTFFKKNFIADLLF